MSASPPNTSDQTAKAVSTSTEIPSMPTISPSTVKTAKKELYGWGGIEDNLLKHDTVWVQSYANDIDSLLVFVSETLSTV